MRNILVTGGAGYAGSRPVAKLLERGERVTVSDILFFGAELSNSLMKSITAT